jgi:hypothetical protein
VPVVVAALAAASAAARLLKQLAIEPLLAVGVTLLYCVITCVRVTVCPAQSVADQVRVITLEQVEVGLLCVWLVVTVSSAPKLLVAVTTGTAGIWLAHWTVTLAGTPSNTGWLVKIVAV